MSPSDPLIDDGEILSSTATVTSPEAGGIAPPAGIDSKPVIVWEYDKIAKQFGTVGCSVPNCPFHDKGNAIYKCALNLSDAIIRAGYTPLPPAPNVNLCPHGRVRNADGMARIIQKVCGKPKARGWGERPTWRGVLYFEDGPSLERATGHIDLWDGSSAVHNEFPDAKIIWLFKLIA